MTPGDVFRGQKTRLTACTKDDLEVLLGWQQDSIYLRLFDAIPAYPKDAEGLAAWLEQARSSPNDFLFAIRRLSDDALVGLGEIDGVLWAHQAAGMSLGIGNPAHRQQGYGYDAARLLLRFAFHELNLHRMTVTIFAYNTGSLALFKKLGFVQEGVYREFLQRDGQRHDMFLFGLLRPEWQLLDL